MAFRNYTSVAPNNTLSKAITDLATSLLVSDYGDVYPAVPFTLIIDADTVNEEIVEVTSKNGTHNLFTVTRGVDGTTAKAHSVGAPVIHGVSGRDFQEAVGSTDIKTMLVMTQAEYDAIETPDPNTLYVVTD